jgi:acyl dehydratase
MMTTETTSLPEYRVRACNTAAESENRIHDDAVAAGYGFRGGLVPGVIVYGYMTVPLVERYSMDWLERGSMQVKFHLPFYEGEHVIVRSEIDRDSHPTKIAVTASREDEIVCATALATVDDPSLWLGPPTGWSDRAVDLPSLDARPAATLDSLRAGTRLGTVSEAFDSKKCETELLDRIGEKLSVYFGAGAVAHPSFLLGLCNQALVRNYKLGPWIHTASEIKNWSSARDGELIAVNGMVRDSYERKGHEFVVLDLEVSASRRLVQQVRHTAIFRPRSV